jgi:hypothetical protein
MASEQIDANAAYQRGWKSSRYHDDSVDGFEQSRARFAKKYGENLANAWEQGWADGASRAIEDER